MQSSRTTHVSLFVEQNGPTLLQNSSFLSSERVQKLWKLPTEWWLTGEHVCKIRMEFPFIQIIENRFVLILGWFIRTFKTTYKQLPLLSEVCVCLKSLQNIYFLSWIKQCQSDFPVRKNRSANTFLLIWYWSLCYFSWAWLRGNLMDYRSLVDYFVGITGYQCFFIII